MQDRPLDFITPIQFKQVLLIPVKVNLEKLFGKNQIEFQISIKNKKIVIESPEILGNLDFQDNPLEQETTNV